MNTTKLLLSFGAGAATGGIITYIFAHKQSEARAEAEIDEMRAYFSEKTAEIQRIYASETLNDEVEEETTEGSKKEPLRRPGSENYTSYGKYVDQYTKPDLKDLLDSSSLCETSTDEREETEEEEEMMDNSDIADDLPPHNDEEYAPPYEIDIEEFAANELYEKETLVYYEGDDTLSDDNDEIVQMDLVGDCLTRFTSDTIYVRNEKLGIDYEVVRSSHSYSEFILGITPEEKRPRERRRLDIEDDDA